MTAFLGYSGQGRAPFSDDMGDSCKTFSIKHFIAIEYAVNENKEIISDSIIARMISDYLRR